MKKLGVGLIGVQPGRSWAAAAHIPALQALSDVFEIVGIANTSLTSAKKAVEAVGVGRASASVDELIHAADVDVVTVTVKVPNHHDIVMKALNAGKSVYCEWMIGRTLQEAREMAALAREKGVVAVSGTQARVAPAILHVRDLVSSGYVGEILSTTLIGSGMTWGAEIEKANAYALDVEAGVTMLTNPFGHTMAAVADVLGGVASLSAVLATRRKTVRIVETGEDSPMTAPDQVLAAGLLESGAPISIHYRGGMPRGTGLLWEINGTEGDIQVTGIGGHAQMVDLRVLGARGDEKELRELPLPEALQNTHALQGYPVNVARMYELLAGDVHNGTRTAPTFDDGVATQTLIAAVEKAAKDGCKVSLGEIG